MKTILTIMVAAPLAVVWRNACPPNEPRSDVISGVVVDAHSDIPIPGAQVQIVGSYRPQLTGLDGEFCLNGIDEDRTDVEVIARGYATTIVTAVGRHMRIRMDTGVRIAGTVRYDGRPVWAGLTFDRPDHKGSAIVYAQSDQHGRYSIENLERGRYVVTVEGLFDKTRFLTGIDTSKARKEFDLEFVAGPESYRSATTR
jgi:hypothetical protein